MSMNVKSRQQENSELTRDALLDSAREQFIAHGYTGVSIDSIASQARVTKGAFYHHFANKKELLAQCYEQQMRMIAQALDQLPATEDPWLRAQQLATAFIDTVMRHRKRLLSLQEVISVLGWEDWKAIDSRYTLHHIAKLMHELHAAGRVKPYDPNNLTNLVYGFLTQAAISIKDARDKPQAAGEMKLIIRDFFDSLKLNGH